MGGGWLVGHDLQICGPIESPGTGEMQGFDSPLVRLQCIFPAFSSILATLTRARPSQLVFRLWPTGKCFWEFFGAAQGSLLVSFLACLQRFDLRFSSVLAMLTAATAGFPVVHGKTHAFLGSFLGRVSRSRTVAGPVPALPAAAAAAAAAATLKLQK